MALSAQKPAQVDAAVQKAAQVAHEAGTPASVRRFKVEGSEAFKGLGGVGSKGSRAQGLFRVSCLAVEDSEFTGSGCPSSFSMFVQLRSVNVEGTLGRLLGHFFNISLVGLKRVGYL